MPEGIDDYFHDLLEISDTNPTRLKNRNKSRDYRGARIVTAYHYGALCHFDVARSATLAAFNL